MADESISKKTLIEVDIASEDANSKMSSLATTINQVAASVKELQTVTKNSSASLNDYAEKLAQSKLTAQQNREEITRLNLAKRQEKDATDKAKGSIVAAKGSYDEAQKSLTALGRAIKSVEGGFKSTDPAIQKQIAEYNKLNGELKKFDAQMGNHQRNVGNYEGALKGLEGVLDKIIPGFGQLQGVLKGAAQVIGFMPVSTKKAEGGITALAKTTEDVTAKTERATLGFKNFQTGATASGSEATVAAEGVEGLSGAMLGIVTAAAAVIGIFAVIAKHFMELTPNADALGQRFAYLKGALRGFMDDIGQGVGFGQLAEDMKKTAQEAANLKMALQDLSRAQSQDIVDDAKADAQIAELQLKMRNRRNTPAQEKAYFDQIQKISEDKYKGNKDLADKQYELAIKTATNSKRFTDQEIADLRRLGVEYAIQLDKQKGLVNGADDIKAIVEAQQKQIETSKERTMVEERAQNRLDAINMKAEGEAAKQQQLLDKIRQETEQANSERIASIARTLDFQREEFGKELADADEHYRQLIFKQEQFIERQQAIIANPKNSPKVKAAAKQAIGAGRADIAQLRKEQYANQEKLLQDHSKKMLEETQRAANDLAQLQIASIEDAQERERQFEELQYKEKNQALSKEGTLLNENQAKLIAEIKTATGERKTVLQKELENTQTLIETANDKRRELQLQHQQKQLDDLKQFSDQKQAIEDQTSVLKTSKSTVFEGDKESLKAEQKQLLDKYNADVSVKGLTDEKKLELEQEYLNRSKQLNDTYIQNRTAYELQMASQVSNAGFSILQQSLQRSAQAQDVALNKQKDHDLQNTALTSTQKYIVNEKYRVKEGQAKVKQFKQEQKINIAKALIDGYLGIQKSLAEWGMPFAIPFIAATGLETALQVTAIAAQKAPAYAKGGTFQSDGRGSVLPGYSKTDNVNAHLRSGEAVVVSEAMRDPWAKSVVSAINQAYGGRAFDSTPAINWTMPGFASGGVFNNYLPTSDNGLRPQININQSPNRMHPGDIGQIVGGISSAIANMPPPVMDVKDMNYAQGRLAGAIDRLSY
jgi:hypothetical protein